MCVRYPNYFTSIIRNHFSDDLTITSVITHPTKPHQHPRPSCPHPEATNPRTYIQVLWSAIHRSTYSRLQPMTDATKIIKRHWNGRITNDILEGINSVVQLLKRSARGYRNIRNFMTMINLRLGHLDFQLPTWNNKKPFHNFIISVAVGAHLLKRYVFS